MLPNRLLSFLLLLIFGMGYGCSVKYTVPESCNTPTATPFSVAELLDIGGSHPCFDWINSTYWRVGAHGLVEETLGSANSSAGSFVIWSNDTTYGTILGVSATHILDNYFGYPGGATIPAELFDPRKRNGTTDLHITDIDTVTPHEKGSATYLLFHPEIPADQSVKKRRVPIQPGHDYYVVVMDGQLLDEKQRPGPLRLEGVQLDRPAGTEMISTYADVEAGEPVLIVGYAGKTILASELVAGVGQVMNDLEISEVMEVLSAVGDEEAEIPYNPEAEFILKGHTINGMSGGGVFNTKNQLAGIIVRATSNANRSIVRCVRMGYITKQLHTLFGTSNAHLKNAVQPFFDNHSLNEFSQE